MLSVIFLRLTKCYYNMQKKNRLHNLILEFVFLWQMNLLMHLGQSNGHVHAYRIKGTKTLFSHLAALHPVIALQVCFLSFKGKIDLEALNLSWC